jgi:hypothetical protein
MSRLLSMSFLVLFSACTTSSMPGGDDIGDDDGPPPDSGSVSHLDPASCTGFAQNLADAATTCGTSLPSGAQAAFEGWCKKGVTAAEMCGGNPAAGLDCFESSDPTDWVCYFGDAYPACNGDLAAALGAMCVVALGNPSCASGIQCEYDVDCSGNSACNGATGQCFNKSAYCIGLPCTYDVDCPSNEKCNGAEHACVAR